jgi:AcrR family transcriptional regulator
MKPGTARRTGTKDARARLKSISLPDVTRGRQYGQRHLELLDGLESIILTEGFRDLTIGGLAEQLHCSRRTLYEISDSKEGIVLVVVNRLLQRVARRAGAAVQAEASHYDKLRVFLTIGLADLRRTTLAFAEDVAEAPAVHDLIIRHFRYGLAVAAEMVAEGAEAGELVDIHPALAAEILDAGVARLLEPGVLRRSGIGLADGLNEFLELFVQGVRRTPSASQPS